MESCTALLLGATGLVGGHCLDRLLTDERYRRVTTLTRRPLPRADNAAARLDARVVDFDLLAEQWDVAVTDVYCCLGTTMKAAGSRAAFRRVDHDYTIDAARRAHAAGAHRLAIVSAIGADSGSRIFYTRVKGETERDVAALGYECVEIFQPSLLLGARPQPRTGERVAIAVSPAAAGLMIGPLRRYRPIEAEDVAAAMIAALRLGRPGVHTRTYDQIMALARAAG
jgi:uncharacterized protein YbjT (DUF2867 family)